MARRACRLLRGLDRDGRVCSGRAQHLELLVVRTQAAARLADGEDREHAPLRVLQRHKELVLGVPGVGLPRRFHVGHVALADVDAPVERAVRDQEGAAAAVLLRQELLPAAPFVGAAKQCVARLRAAVDVGDAEVVELASIEVEDDGLELERLGNGLDDRRERTLEVALAADHAGHLEQRLDARATERLASFVTPRTRSPHVSTP